MIDAVWTRTFLRIIRADEEKDIEKFVSETKSRITKYKLCGEIWRRSIVAKTFCEHSLEYPSKSCNVHTLQSGASLLGLAMLTLAFLMVLQCQVVIRYDTIRYDR